MPILFFSCCPGIRVVIVTIGGGSVFHGRRCCLN